MTIETTVPAPPPMRSSCAGWRRSPPLTQPDAIHWCDGSAEEYDRLARPSSTPGTFEQPRDAKRPNSYLALSDPGDVARVEDRTFICSEREEDAGPTNNWHDPGEMRELLQRKFKGAMQGRTMYVVPVLDGPARLADRRDRRPADGLGLRRRLDADHDPDGQRRPRRARRRRRPSCPACTRSATAGEASSSPGRATRRSTSSTSPRRARSGPTARATAATRCWARSASRCGSPR